MDPETSSPSEPVPPPGAVGPDATLPGTVIGKVNCIVCGKSLEGCPLEGNCPNCTTPAAVSMPKAAPPAVLDPSLVPGDQLCMKCGYNLRGLPASGFCPECRTPVAQSSGVPITSGQMVADDRPCLVCGYNLKGVAAAGKCPECGTPVARSLRGFLLRYSAPEYLAMLKRGIIMVEVTLGLNVVFGIGIFIYAMAFSALKVKGAATPGTAAVTGAGAGLGLAYEAFQQIGQMLLKWASLLGLWMFTTQDPGLTTQDPAHKSRRFLRIFLTISAVIAMGSSIMVFIPGMQAQLVGSAGGVPGIPMITMLVVVGVVGGIAELIGFVATMNYMAHLSRRIPDAALEKRVRRNRWLLPLIYIFGCGIGGIVGLVIYVILLEDWRKRLKSLQESVLQDDLDNAYTS